MTTQAKYRKFLRDQRGAVAATYALSLVALIAILGLAFDYARMVSMDTELQNAADQAALAGASQLDRQPGAMQRAIDAARGGLVSNSTLISDDGEGRTIDISDAENVQVVFYSTKAEADPNGGATPCDLGRGFRIGDADASDAEARFVEVCVDTREVNYAFTPIVGLFSEGMSASAVAGMGSALCRIPPLMICNPDEPGTPGEVDYPFLIANHRGQGLLAKPGGGGQWTPGNYGYVDVGTNGAIGVREALGWDGPNGACISQDGVDPEDAGTVDTQTGNIASGPQAINTRFDADYQHGCVNGGPCSPSLNSRKDLVRPVALVPAQGNSCDIGNNGWREPVNAYHPTSLGWYTNTPSSMGHPRDVCHAVEDGVTGNCKNQALGPTVSAGTEGTTPGNWDRDTYFRTHFGWTTRNDWLAGIAGATLGVSSPSRDRISRYDVYKWEEAQPATRLVDSQWGPAGSEMTTRNQPVCGQTYGFTPKSGDFDRRRVTVAVVNCNRYGVSGSSSGVPVETWIDVFMVQPSYDRGPGNKFTRKDEIYAEIIDVTDISRVGAPIGPTIRRDVPYLVR